MLYVYTNENLHGINDGLDVKGNVLSILGSGDQAFTFLEKADSVVGIDTSIEQLKYTERRMELLRDRLYDEFLYAEENLDYSSPGFLFNRSEYLRPKLDRIRENLGRLTLKQGDITDQSYDGLDRIYFSNALDIGLGFTIPEKTQKMFDKLFVQLKPGSLIYITDFLLEVDYGVFDPTNSIKDIVKMKEFFESASENERQAMANKLYWRWIPRIYRKR